MVDFKIFNQEELAIDIGFAIGIDHPFEGLEDLSSKTADD
jgi:hypothetical protein